MGADACVVVMRAGTSAVEAFKKHLSPTQARSILAGCKARRGGRPRCASLSCGGCCGGGSSPCRRLPRRAWRGPAGAVGINAWPHPISPHVVAHDRSAVGCHASPVYIPSGVRLPFYLVPDSL
jgi:hypothetical protein